MAVTMTTAESPARVAAMVARQMRLPAGQAPGHQTRRLPDGNVDLFVRHADAAWATNLAMEVWRSIVRDHPGVAASCPCGVRWDGGAWAGRIHISKRTKEDER